MENIVLSNSCKVHVERSLRIGSIQIHFFQLGKPNERCSFHFFLLHFQPTEMFINLQLGMSVNENALQHLESVSNGIKRGLL